MMPRHRGSCHCGAVRFEIEAEIDHVRACDCSICTKRGALMFRVREQGLRLLTPLSGLSLYRWGSLTAEDYFCPVCGVLPFRRPGHPTPEERARGIERFEGWTVNVRCLEGFDVSSVPTRLIYGSRL